MSSVIHKLFQATTHQNSSTSRRRYRTTKDAVTSKSWPPGNVMKLGCQIYYFGVKTFGFWPCQLLVAPIQKKNSRSLSQSLDWSNINKCLFWNLEFGFLFLFYVPLKKGFFMTLDYFDVKYNILCENKCRGRAEDHISSQDLGRPKVNRIFFGPRNFRKILVLLLWKRVNIISVQIESDKIYTSPCSSPSHNERSSQFSSTCGRF